MKRASRLRMALGGAICGSFLGVGGGALVGALYGAFAGNLCLGLDGALLGGCVLALGGAACGAILKPPDAAPTIMEIAAGEPSGAEFPLRSNVEQRL